MTEKTGDHDRPERRSGKPKRTSKGGDPHGSSTQEKAGDRPPEPSEAGAGVQPGSGSASKRGTGRWRSLAQVTISVETFCEEVTRFSGKWSTDFIDEKKRQKAAKEADKLAGWGKEVRNRAMQFLGRPESRQEGSQTRQLEAAWRRLKAVDLALKLNTIIEYLEGMRKRLREQYSTEAIHIITEDFRRLSHAVTDLNQTSRRVRETLRIQLDRSGFSTGQTTLLRSLIEEITKAVTGTTKAVGDAWLEHGRFSKRIPQMIDNARSIKHAYERLSESLKREFGNRLRTAISGGQEEIRRITDYLEDIEEVLATTRGWVAYADMVERLAGAGVGCEVGDTAEQLKEVLDELQITFKKLGDMVRQYKDIVRRAPFKRLPTAKRTKPVPPWERLSQREQHLVSALVSLRRHDPAQEWYAVSKKILEERLGLSENDSTLNRDLQLLEDEYGIVGKYQPLSNAEQQQTAYGYWIEEYAYKLYGPRVLGSDGSEASSESQTS